MVSWGEWPKPVTLVTSTTPRAVSRPGRIPDAPADSKRTSRTGQAPAWAAVGAVAPGSATARRAA